MSNLRRLGGEQHPPQRSRKKPKRSRRWLAYTLLILFGMMLGVGGMVASFLYKAYQTLPTFEAFDPSLTSVILDNKEQVVYKLAADENRTLIKSIDEIPLEVRQAFIATEDRRFYEHFGVDLYRMAGAIWQDIKYFAGVKGAQLEGGSTITMQLARNAFLTLDQNLMRKVQEMMIAIDLERRFTKDEILLQYLNQVSFGYQAAGLEAAAQTYFSKSARELTLSEGAMLAGMLKAPSTYNPFDNYEGAMKRRAIVLDLMHEQGYIDAEQLARLKAEKVELKPAKVTPTTVTFTGDWYVDYVIQILTDKNLSEKYGTPVFEPKSLYSQGLKIYTALDLEAQRIAQEKLDTWMPWGVKEFGGGKQWPLPEAAVVTMNHQTGEVKALIGGMKHEQMLTYNRATQALRQPGSAFKPLVAYLPAIDLLGWGPGTVIDDSPPMLNADKTDVWPRNYEGVFTGLQSMRYGLEQSINTIAVRTLQSVTPRKGLEYARKLGISTLVDASMNPRHNDENLSLALGGITMGVTPLDMAQAYGTLGSLGMRVDPIVITRIENKHGEVIFQATRRAQPVVARDSAWLMVDIMKGSLLRGTASFWSKGFNGWPAAGKTGTTEDWHDAWFAGFTPELVTVVWTGYDNDEKRDPLPYTGSYHWTGAGPPTKIWTEIMTELTRGKVPPDWERPKNIVSVEICRTSGLLRSPLCPKEEYAVELFKKGTEPTKADNVWTVAKVVKQPWTNPRTKKVVDRYYLWQEGCGTAEERHFIKRPTTYARHPSDPNNEAYWPRDWVKELPTEKCTPQAAPEPKPGNGNSNGDGNGTGGNTTVPWPDLPKPPATGGGNQPPAGGGN